MGLRVLTEFDTPEGFPVTSVYLRIARLLLSNFVNRNVTITIMIESHISREKRLINASTVPVPAMPYSFDFEIPMSSCTEFDMLYTHVKQCLMERGFTVEDVFES